MVAASVRVVERPVSSQLVTHYGDPDVSKPHVILILRDSGGNRGWGEATPLPHFNGETAAGISRALSEHYAPRLIGSPVLNITAALVSAETALPGNTAARCAVDMALHDLAANALGVPLNVLLGGQCRSVVSITRPIGICSSSEAAALAERYVAAGHQTLKLKVGSKVETDIKRVKTVRDAVGANVAIRIDGNQGYDYLDAARVLDRLATCDLEYCEQPLRAADYAGHAELRRTGVRIAIDEGIHSVSDALKIAELRAADVLVIKMIKCAGFRSALQIDAVAEAAGMRSVVVSPYDTQIGAAHGLHLASALRTCTYACELTSLASQSDMATSAHQFQSGEMHVSEKAGVGVSGISELGDLQSVSV